MTLPPEPRTVKPRKPTGAPWLPIIALDRDSRSIFCEMTGSIHGWNEAPILFRSHPPAIVVSANAAYLVHELDSHYARDEMWQYRVTPLKRETYNPDPTRRRRIVQDTLVNYFGWKGTSYTTSGGKKANRKGHWHYPLDPTLFCNSPVRTLIGGLAPGDLLAWAQDVREWCHANGLHPSPTAGGLGGQLLRDPRWYPAPRRKVPRATNARARSALPGNHYRLYWPENIPVDATYIDMSGSHHHAAAQVTFPCANHLYARGDFHTPRTPETPGTEVKVWPPIPERNLWAPQGTRRYRSVIGSHGLLLLQVNVPTLRDTRFPPPFMERPGRKLAWVFTNELPMVHELGGDIEGVAAAWTSYEPDTGLNQYAVWAQSEIAHMDAARKRWAKVVLLATYGNLAAKARITEFGYRVANHGVKREYPAGPSTLTATAHIGDIEREIPTVNVIHRGMIEAEQRRITLELARELTSHKVRVLSIYADALIVRSDRALPLLPPPWRVESHLTRLRFFSAVSFDSAERTKLPGIASEDRERYARIASIRRR